MRAMAMMLERKKSGRVVRVRRFVLFQLGVARLPSVFLFPWRYRLELLAPVFSPIGYHALPSVFLPVDLGCILAPEPFFYLDFGQRSSLDVNAPCKWTDQNMF